MATARHHADQWRSDFEKLSGSFAIFTLLGEDFTAYDAWPTLADYDRWAARCGVVTATGRPVRFVEMRPKPRRRARRARSGDEPSYETRVLSGEVPTRVGHWHDFFNALAWCVFPRIKAALNARQVAGGIVPGRRSAEQNRLAMFDEGGIALVRGAGGDRELVVGHALCEGVLRGQEGLRGFPLVVEASGLTLRSLVAAADEHLGARISGGGLVPAAHAEVDVIPVT